MKGKARLWQQRLLALSLMTAAGAAWGQTPGACARHASTTQLTDMAGRTLTLPSDIQRVATVGSVPVINSYLMALGAADRIVNGLSARFTTSDRWSMHLKLAPSITHLPVLQAQTGTDINLEELMRLKPDIVLTMDRASIRSLETARIPVIHISWSNETDIHQNVSLLGCILDRRASGEAYLAYFDTTLQRVRQIVDAIPAAQRPKVLYFNPHTMATPLAIANWWITEAGGQSMTQDWGSAGNAQYTHERLLQWNPDVLIVNSPEQVDAIYRDERFSRLSAVQHQRVHVTPMGSHLWGQRTIEQPLTVLWAASLIHPSLFPPEALKQDIQFFYQRFLGYPLSDAEIDTLLSGKQSSPP